MHVCRGVNFTSLLFMNIVWWEKIPCKISLNQWRITTDQYSYYKGGKMFRLESPLCLVLGSWCDSGKWILFSVDRVNVRTSWESPLWIADGVTQLLFTKNLKEIMGKDKLVRSKLLEELNSLFLFSGGLGASTARNRNLFFLLRIFWATPPLLHSKHGYL